MDSIYNKKILVTGSQGYLGENLIKYFKSKKIKTFSLDLKSKNNSSKIDITKKQSIDLFIKKIKPDVVIHCAALSNLTECEKDPKAAKKINFIGTKNIVDCLNKTNPNATLFFMSSDYVFQGNKGNYKEEDSKNPKTVYGQTKLLAENYIKANYRNNIICRSANIFGRGGKFFEFALDQLSKEQKTDFFVNTFYSPTYIDYFLESVFKLLNSDCRGSIHVAGKERISRYKFALSLAKYLGINPGLVKKIKQPSGGLISIDSSLNSKKFDKIVGYPCPTINQALEFSLNLKSYPQMFISDPRGKMIGVLREKVVREINYAETKKNKIRGGHYHGKTTEIFFIIKGKIKITLLDLKSKKQSVFFAHANDIVTINKNVVHYFETITDSAWINMLSKELEYKNEDLIKV